MRESASLLRMEAVLTAASHDGENTGGGSGQQPPTVQEAKELYLAKMSKVLDG